MNILYGTGSDARKTGLPVDVLHWKSRGMGVSHNSGSEMTKMNERDPVYIPPVYLEDYSEFRELAKEAAVVVCDPQYILSPFADDKKRLRRLIVTALGVRRKDVPLTFSYTVDHERALRRYGNMTPSDALTRLVSEVMQDLEYNGNLVRGSVPLESTLGEVLEERS